MKIRDRIKEFRRVPASDLLPNPKNWRTHGEDQRNVIRGLLAEVGFADAVLVREIADGQLMLIDGHCRVEETPDAVWPCLILDVDEAEADLLLASLDPSAAMAAADAVKLNDLLQTVNTSSEALGGMLSQLAEEHGVIPTTGKTSTASAAEGGATEGAPEYQEQFGVCVMCRDAEHQQEVYEALLEEGYECKVVYT